MLRIPSLLPLSIALLLSAGCAGTGGKEEPITDTQGVERPQGTTVDTAQGTDSQDQTDGATTQGMQSDSSLTLNALEDPNSPLSTRVIYFDFDSTQIQPEFREVITAHAQFLAANPDVSVILQGHADERGSREYNIGLGERRARAVEQVFSLHGTNASQMQKVSYGEERPAAMGHDEASWRLNRRVEIVYKGQ